MKWILLLTYLLQVVHVLHGQGAGYTFAVPDVSSVSSGGDFNGDGYDDICIACSSSSNGKVDNGKWIVTFGGLPDPTFSTSDGFINASKAVQIFGASDNDGVAYIRCAFVGDVNGDGYDDVLLAQSGSSMNDVIHLVYGTDNTTSIDLNTFGTRASRGMIIRGVHNISSIKRAGDVNLDGYDDFLVVVPRGVYVIFGDKLLPPQFDTGDSNTTNLATIISIPSSSFAYDAVGVDFNKDGYSDVAVAVGGNNAVFVVYGKSNMSREVAEGDANFTVALASTGKAFNVDAVDMNGDGYGDVIVTGADGYIIYGGGSRNNTLVDLDGLNAVSGAMNLDGSGFGSAVFSVTTLVYVLYGSHNLSETIDTSSLNGTNGFSVQGAMSVTSGDTNNDGIDELIVVRANNVEVQRMGVDSCKYHNCSANATCINDALKFSYTCVCKSGYKGNGTDCSDIIECANSTLNNCTGLLSTCVNDIGGFHCECPSGYNFSSNGRDCTDIDECKTQTSNCSEHAACSNSVGSFSCSCRSGYLGNGYLCLDINECQNTTLNNCTSNQNCSNTNGSFVCACKPGYFQNMTICSDINECTANMSNCSSNASCANTNGSFQCSCKTGYMGDGYNCTVIDACINASSICVAGTCVNTKGGYQCTCKSGFISNGFNCTDINECKNSTMNNCTGQFECVNENGGFHCGCPTGYNVTSDGKNCTDINECMGKGFNCSGTSVCVNEVGGYYCSCPTGFRLSSSQGCEDVDECNSTLNTCPPTISTCFNTEGSFYCLYYQETKTHELSGGQIGGIMFGVILGGAINVGDWIWIAPDEAQVSTVSYSIEWWEDLSTIGCDKDPSNACRILYKKTNDNNKN